MYGVENSTSPEVHMWQIQLSTIALSCRYQADIQGDYEASYQAGFQAGFNRSSDNAFKCQQDLQWTLYHYNSHVVNTDIHASLDTSLI
jgi:hypothetical protein